MRFSSAFENPLLQTILATLLLSCPLWYNGCPLFYPDSMGYVFWGMKGEIVPERVSTYALFIKWFSPGGNIWIPVLIQSFLLAGTIRFLWFRILGLQIPALFFLVCFLLGLASPLGWTAAMLMPDIFCVLSSLFLIFFLEFFSGLRWWEKAAILVLYLFFSLFHIGILPINMLILSAYGLIFLLQKKLKSRALPLGLAVVLTCFSFAGIGLVHWHLSGTFFTSKTSGAFLVARFAETGILNQYLNQHCPDPANPLCSHRSDFPMQAEVFLWSPDSPLNKEIGLYDPRGDLGKVVNGVFSDPVLLAKFALSGLGSGLKQALLLDLGDGLGPYPELPQLNVFTANASDYLGSKQRAGIDFLHVNLWCRALLVFLVLFALRNKAFFNLSSTMEQFGIFIIILLISNALVNGALSTPLNRYQVRVFWLVYLWLFAALYPAVKNYFSSSAAIKT